MLILVSGGAASGKSGFAEDLALASGGRRVYLATMRVWDSECAQRVDRHRSMRAGKGFSTLECPENLSGAEIPAGSTVLLEDLSNLCANEWFGERGPQGAFERILSGVDHICALAGRVIVVTNELFSDGISYDKETTAYLGCLARLNRALAHRADELYEVVCGIPIYHKGDGRDGRGSGVKV